MENCNICKCRVNNGSLAQHKAGKKHRKNLKLLNIDQPEEIKKEKRYSVEDFLKSYSPLFEELDFAFPEKTALLYRCTYPSKKIFTEVLTIFNSILFDIECNEEIEEETLDILQQIFSILVFPYEIRPQENSPKNFLKKLEANHFMILFRTVLTNQFYNKAFSEHIFSEIEKYINYYDLRNDFEEENMNLVQERIQQNFEKAALKTANIYTEARKDFEENSLF